MAKMGVYGIMIEGHDSLIYVGSSVDVRKRWSNHKSRLRKGNHDYQELQIAWNQDPNSLRFILIEEVEENELSKAEYAYISYFLENDWDVINENNVYKGRGNRYSDEIKKKMSERQRGSGNGNAKLSEADVDSIRKLIKEGFKSKDIAGKYNVSPSLIDKIKYGVRWKHVG